MAISFLAPQPAAAAPPLLGLEVVATGLTNVTSIISARDGSGRLFITQQTGQIRVLSGGQLLATNFLDITSLLPATAGTERGLLGLAFSPGYNTNGLLYITYTGLNGDVKLARYSVSTDPNIANTNLAQVLLSVGHSANNNHNGGQLQFGPDGYLYMTVGDGGSGCDPSDNAQNLSRLLGKMLRLDVNTNTSYAIPPTNPFVGVPGVAPEIWAYGLRNPWRFSFDRVTGDLYIGDAGESSREEVDFQPVGDPGGENYGWRLYEGFLTNTCSVIFSNVPTALPIFDYSHTNGNCVVIGGYVYRGTTIAPLVGTYLYGDYCGGQISGATTNGTGGWTTSQLFHTNIQFSTFGEDENGELYIAQYDASGLGAAVFRVGVRDSASDGIPDWWRALYFGGSGATTNPMSCASCDPDGDGMSNYQEFEAGTDPTNSASAVYITTLALSLNDLGITWATLGGLTNIVQVTPGAIDGSYSNSFINLSPPIIALGNGITSTNFLVSGGATNSPAQYYRVRTVLPPVADDASDPAYGIAWPNGSNGGKGFTPWLLALGGPGLAGFGIGSSTNNGLGDSPGIDVNGKSWCLAGATPFSRVIAARAFASGPLRVGQSFLVNLDMGASDLPVQCGLILRFGKPSINFTVGTRFEFLYAGGAASNTYQVIDSGGQHDSGVPYADTGVRLVFTLTGTNTYTLLAVDNASNATNTLSGSLATAFGTTIDSFTFINMDGTNNQKSSFYVNSLKVIGP